MANIFEQLDAAPSTGNVFEQLDAQHGAGGGRGGQGGPTAAQNAQRTPQPVQQPQTAEPGLFDKTATAIRGFGQGATAGLIQYPQAGLMSMVNGEDFNSNLADLRKQNSDLAETQPAQWYGGNVAGGVALGATTGGGGLGVQLAKNTLVGAVQGATEKEDPVDTLLGAGVGAGLSLLGAGGAKVLQYGTNKIASTQVIGKLGTMIDDAKKGSVEALDKLDKLFAAGKYSTVDDGVTGLEVAQDAVESLGQGKGGTKVSQIPSLVEDVPNTLTTPLKTHAAAIWDAAKSGAMGAGEGYVANVLYDKVTGKPLVDPVTAITGGALLHGGAAARTLLKNAGADALVRTIISKPGQAVVNNLPSVGGTIGATGTAASGAMIPQVVQGANPPPNIFDQLDSGQGQMSLPAEETDTRSLLQKTIDEDKAAEALRKSKG